MMNTYRLLLRVPLWTLFLASLISCGRSSTIAVGKKVAEVGDGLPIPTPTPYFSPTPTMSPEPTVIPPFPTLPPIAPTPPPAPGPLACNITKAGPLTQAGQPVPFILQANGPIQFATINGVPVTPGQPIAVFPLFEGTYVANGFVAAGGVSAGCQAVFQVPRCSFALLEEKPTRIRVEMTMQGAIAQAFINDEAKTLTAQNRVTHSFDPEGPGTVTGRVIGPGGDEGTCEIEYDFPITTTAGTATHFYFTTGYPTSGTSTFLMGGGVVTREQWGWWQAIAGTSNFPIHTGVSTQRGNDCASNEIVVSFGVASLQSLWNTNSCAPLVEGLELYEPRVVYVAWNPNQTDKCADGEVLTGTSFERGDQFSVYGGRLILKCSKVRWEE